jgi:branched-chain amino acid transport system substrate-binding protein
MRGLVGGGRPELQQREAVQVDAQRSSSAPRRVPILVGAAVLALALAACSSTKSPNGSSATGSAVNIGLICSCTGGLASSMSSSPATYEAWASEVNAHGGINGHRVNVISMNDALNPGTALTEAHKLIDVDHVVALVDSSTEDASWASYASQKGVPIVGGDAQSTLQLTDADLYPAGETIDGFFVTYAYAAKRVGATNIGNLYCAESPSCAQAVTLLRSTAKALNLTVGYVTEISASQPSYTAACLAAKQAGVTGLLVGEAVATVQVVAQQCSAQGYNPYYIEGDGAIAKSFTNAPGLEDHFIGFEQDVPFFLNNTAGTKLMNDSLKKYAPSVLSSPNYGEENTQMWVSGLLFQEAAKKSNAGKNGPITSAEIVNGLHQISNDTLGGMAPPLTFKAGQPNPVHCWFWVSIQNHTFTAPSGATPICPST